MPKLQTKLWDRVAENPFLASTLSLVNLKPVPNFLAEYLQLFFNIIKYKNIQLSVYHIITNY